MADIVISLAYFEHLLTCLANQKFINDINADALSGDTDYRKIQQEIQQAIDLAWMEGMDRLYQAKYRGEDGPSGENQT